MRFGFHAFGRTAVDHAKDPASLFGFGYHYLDRVRSRAVYIRYFRNRLNAAEHIDRKSVAQRDDKDVPRGECSRIVDHIAFQCVVVAVHACKTLAGSFVESDPELNVRRGIDDRLINILYGLDEVALPDDDIAVLGNGETD